MKTCLVAAVRGVEGVGFVDSAVRAKARATLARMPTQLQ
jgi:hypothetical protein